MPEEAIASTERWFRSRGVPHFIDNYNAREDILTRAMPVLVLTLLLEALLFIQRDFLWWVNVLIVVFILALMLGSWAALNFARGRRPLSLPERVGWIEVSVYLLLPGSLAAILDWNWRHFVELGVLNAGILGVTLVGRLGVVVGLFARALPLLMLVVTFLFINEEVWRVTSHLETALLGAVAGLFGLMGLLFLAARLPAEISNLEEFHSLQRIRELVRATPLDGIPLDESTLRLDIPCRSTNG